MQAPSFIAPTKGQKTMDHNIPTSGLLKQQARRLRQDLAHSGHAISHALALEKVAHLWGARDWNTLAAAAPRDSAMINRAIWQIGQRVSGRYIGQRFEGSIKSANRQTAGFWRLTLVFDNAVDVVTSEHFSNFRKQIACTINAQGVSPARTSDGAPQMRIFPA